LAETFTLKFTEAVTGIGRGLNAIKNKLESKSKFKRFFSALFFIHPSRYGKIFIIISFLFTKHKSTDVRVYGFCKVNESQMRSGYSQSAFDLLFTEINERILDVYGT
jgi:hypothetical protein